MCRAGRAVRRFATRALPLRFGVMTTREWLHTTGIYTIATMLAVAGVSLIADGERRGWSFVVIGAVLALIHTMLGRPPTS